MSDILNMTSDELYAEGKQCFQDGDYEFAAPVLALAATKMKRERDEARQQLEAQSTALGRQIAATEVWVTTPRHVSSNQQIPAMEWLNENERIGKLFITPGGRKQFGRHYRVTARHLGNKPKLNRKGELVITPDEAPVFQATLEYMEQYSQTANMIALDR